MPEYLEVVLTIFLIATGISFIWLCFWISLFVVNYMADRRD